MRLLLDLQACQTGSRHRGIGRYAMNLAQAIAGELGSGDELVIAVDMADAERTRDIRRELHDRGVHAKVVAYGYPVLDHSDSSTAVRTLAGQLRSRFYASLRPDVLLISSLFETGDAHSSELDWSALAHIPMAVVGYDLIPMKFPYYYLLEGGFGVDFYRSRLHDLLKFDLVLSISEATKHDLVTQLGMDGNSIAVIGAGFDETLTRQLDDVEAARRLLELGVQKPFVLMVGNGDWRKNTLGALQAFACLSASLRDTHQLVLTQVGADVRSALAGEYAHLADSVRILGKVGDSDLVLLYHECAAFYFPSYYEGFGLPVLEAMACGAPVLSSSAGSLPEVVRDARTLFDPHVLRDGVALLERVLTDSQFREEIRRDARAHALGFTWERTARLAVAALRELEKRGSRNLGRLPVTSPWPAEDDVQLMAGVLGEVGESGANALRNGLRAIAARGKRRVLVDITEMIRLDAGTGIHRVVRRFFEGLMSLAHERGDFEVEPIHATSRGVFYAREFARTRFGASCAGPDSQVQAEPSDLVFMLDANWEPYERFDELHAQVRAMGGESIWMVYDLVPVRFPKTCNPIVPPAFEAWLKHAVNSADGFVCISEATRRDLEAFMAATVDTRTLQPWTRSIHLGFDMDPAAERQPTETGRACRAAIGDRRWFTAVGTVEPRKDYMTILDAFELLWDRDTDVVLVIIGKQGWNVQSLVERINRHPQLNRRLFWLQDASDGDVRHLLEGSVALVQASISEGFGLPLIEAGSLGVPLLVSDIPVFHEVAGDVATYFPVGNAVSLANSLMIMFDGKEIGRHPVIPSRNWHEASRELVGVLGLSADCSANPEPT